MLRLERVSLSAIGKLPYSSRTSIDWYWIITAPLLHVDTTANLPDSADVVVIGGGIVGVCAAWYLTRRGVSVALLEKGRIGAEQSSRNWGWCRQQNRAAHELPIATASMALWDNIASEIGENVGFERCGLLYLSDDDAELARWARWRDFARTHNVETLMLSASQASQRGQATARQWKGGVFSPSDGIANPKCAAPLIAKGIMKFGGSVHQNCAARGIETQAGRVSAVVTESGTVRTQQVVLAGGAWASSFCHQLDIRFPQASVRSSILAVGAGTEGIPDALHTNKVSVTRRGNDGYTLAISGRASVDPTPQQLRFARYYVPMFMSRWRYLSAGGFQGWSAGHESLARWSLEAQTPMERVRILDPKPSARVIKQTLERARTLLPGLKHADLTAAWAGYIDSTPDGMPVIDNVDQLPGFMLAAGFSGHGFGIGPGAGHLIADIVTNNSPIVDPAPYMLGRLNDSAWGKVADF